MNKVYIETNGCAVLRHETYKIAKYVELNGFEEVDNPKEANYIIISGCGVIKQNEDYIIRVINDLYEKNNDHAQIIVVGCISTLATKRINNISNNIIQIRNENLDVLDDLFYESKRLNDVYFNINPKRHHSKGDPLIVSSEEEIRDFEFAKAIDDFTDSTNAINEFNYSTRGKHLWREKDLFEIRVAYGCTGKCSYCATKIAIGDFRSINEQLILNQAILANKEGYNRIMLMGDEIGAWSENNKNIVDLIEDILKINPNFKIGIRYIHPDILVKYYSRFVPLFKNGSIYYFCSAYQSGSEHILKLMNRNPNIEPFIKCMEDMNKNNYPVLRHTQIIVGFPGETDTDFLRTINSLQRCSFDHVTISEYSPRENTMSYSMNTLDKIVIKERMKLLNDWLELNRSNKLYKVYRDEFTSFNNELIRKKNI